MISSNLIYGSLCPPPPPRPVMKSHLAHGLTLAWEKDLLVSVNVYTGKDWNKAIHNGLTLSLVLTWDCHASQNSKMVAEVFLQMTS